MKRYLIVMALMAMTFLSCEKPQTDEQPPHLKPEVVPPATQDPDDDGILSILFIGNSDGYGFKIAGGTAMTLKIMEFILRFVN